VFVEIRLGAMPAMTTNNRHGWRNLTALTASLALFAACACVFRAGSNNDEISGLVDSVAPASVAIECQRTLPVGDTETGISLLVPIQVRGSGVIVSEDGLIVTNHHIVTGAVDDSIVVTLYNGERTTARVVGSDAAADLAVLKVRMRHLPFLHIGRAEDLRRGQRVISLGNGSALGRNGDLAVTVGVISGVRRSIVPGSQWCEMDAHIYPGCSGGPVCDMSGRVVGINVALDNFLKPFFIPLDATNRAALSKMSGGRV
jgi:S1-C subfamily serine protease